MLNLVLESLQLESLKKETRPEPPLVVTLMALVTAVGCEALFAVTTETSAQPPTAMV